MKICIFTEDKNEKVSKLILGVCLAIGLAIAFTGYAYSEIATKLMTSYH